jgi:hypothetical protein
MFDDPHKRMLKYRPNLVGISRAHLVPDSDPVGCNRGKGRGRRKFVLACLLLGLVLESELACSNDCRIG